MSFRLLYHPEVVSADIARLDKRVKGRLSRALAQRLETQPESFGRPLRGSLAGYWKLRVGDYRVVFRVVRSEVWVYAIIHRKDVYEDVLKRLEWRA